MPNFHFLVQIRCKFIVHFGWGTTIMSRISNFKKREFLVNPYINFISTKYNLTKSNEIKKNKNNNFVNTILS